MESQSNEYRRLHYWINRTLGSPIQCSKCGRNDTKTVYDWSNISGEYKKEVTDWERLCRSCHRFKDFEKTHCIHGHELSGYNLIIRKDRPGHRDCRECRNESLRRARRKK